MERRKAQLRKNKTIAGGMMVCAAILFIIARSQRGPGWDWVAAFSEAAMVGALADWFAVVALFRHPMGVPVPHTAIIPAKKEAIADNLAQFIHDKFLATDALVAKLREADAAGRLCTYLSSEANAQWLASGIAGLISESVDFVDDERVANVLKAALSDRLEKFDLATSAGTVIDTLRKGDRHQAVLDDLLNRLAVWLATEEAQAKFGGFIDKWLGSEFPMLSMFIPNREQFAQGAGEKVAKKTNELIQEVNADPQHELRQKFDSKVAEFALRLKGDEGLRSKIEEIKSEALNDVQLGEYVKSMSNDLKKWLREDLQSPQPKVRQKIGEIAAGVGKAISGNQQLKDSINEHLETLARQYAGRIQAAVTRHVAGTVKQWEDEQFVREIELSIGSDLQFIRMNGTLVGGAIGLLLHCVTLLLK